MRISSLAVSTPGRFGAGFRASLLAFVGVLSFGAYVPMAEAETVTFNLVGNQKEFLFEGTGAIDPDFKYLTKADGVNYASDSDTMHFASHSDRLWGWAGSLKVPSYEGQEFAGWRFGHDNQRNPGMSDLAVLPRASFVIPKGATKLTIKVRLSRAMPGTLIDHIPATSAGIRSSSYCGISYANQYNVQAPGYDWGFLDRPFKPAGPKGIFTHMDGEKHNGFDFGAVLNYLLAPSIILTSEPAQDWQWFSPRQGSDVMTSLGNQKNMHWGREPGGSTLRQGAQGMFPNYKNPSFDAPYQDCNKTFTVDLPSNMDGKKVYIQFVPFIAAFNGAAYEYGSGSKTVRVLGRFAYIQRTSGTVDIHSDVVDLEGAVAPDRTAYVQGYKGPIPLDFQVDKVQK